MVLGCFGQEYGKYKIGPEFNSVFKNLNNGQYTGTINGALFILKENSDTIILDFQAGNANLNIIPDTNKVYDHSTKVYTGNTTSGKTSILYSTYSMANKLTIELTSGHFAVGSHDGASDMVINGINYSYYTEEGMEYLAITFDKDVTLDNFWWLRQNGNDAAKSHQLKQKITIRSNSAIIFAIKR